MNTKVKTHKRKGKNKVSVVKEHTRKGKKSCDTSKCSVSDLRKGAKGAWGEEFKALAQKELNKRGK